MNEQDRRDACRAGRRVASALQMMGSTDAAATVYRLIELLLDDEQVVKFGEFSEALDEARLMHVTKESR